MIVRRVVVDVLSSVELFVEVDESPGRSAAGEHQEVYDEALAAGRRLEGLRLELVGTDAVGSLTLGPVLSVVEVGR